jgi:SnoaL-like domain
MGSLTPPTQITCRPMPRASNVGVVRMLWAAARENDVDALLSLTAHDVDWRPTAVAAPGLRGRDALRDYLAGLRAAGRLVDAHPYSFEAVGDCVMSAASCACAATMAAWRRSSAGGSIAWPAARSPRPAATAAAATRCATPATNRQGATRQTAARDRRAPGPRLLSCPGGTRGGWTPLALRRMKRGAEAVSGSLRFGGPRRDQRRASAGVGLPPAPTAGASPRSSSDRGASRVPR